MHAVIFVFAAVALVAVALVWVLPPLLRRRGSAERGVDQSGTNLALLQDQLAELDAEHQRGALADEQYRVARAELERRVLDEQSTPSTPAAATAFGVRASAVVIGVVLPLAAVLLYLRLGQPDALNPQASVALEHAATPEQLSQMIEQLAQRLEREPNNIEGWAMLARSYYHLRRFPDAARAYERLAKLLPDDADLLAEWADALAMANNRTLAGRPNELVLRALELNPTQWKALALAGTAAFERNDFRAAVDYWERLRTSLPPDNALAQSIAGSIAEARERGGLGPSAGTASSASKPGPVARAAAPAGPAASAGGSAGASAGASASASTSGSAAASAKTAASKDQQAKDAAGSVAGTVRLSPQLAARAAPDDVVFVFARAAEGPRAPLAVQRLQVKDLPAKFALDDRASMSPERPLSSSPVVIVGARISKSGNAMPTAGDLEGLSTPIKVGAQDVAITIDRVLQ